MAGVGGGREGVWGVGGVEEGVWGVGGSSRGGGGGWGGVAGPDILAVATLPLLVPSPISL